MMNLILVIVAMCIVYVAYNGIKEIVDEYKKD